MEAKTLLTSNLNSECLRRAILKLVDDLSGEFKRETEIRNVHTFR